MVAVVSELEIALCLDTALSKCGCLIVGERFTSIMYTKFMYCRGDEGFDIRDWKVSMFCVGS